MSSLNKIWKQASKDFENLTMKKKPNEKVGKHFYSSSSAFSNALSAMDTCDDELESLNTKVLNKKATLESAQKKLKDLEKKQNDIVSVADKYLANLKDIISKESSIDDKTIWDRGMKFLVREVNALSAQAEAIYEQKAEAVKVLGMAQPPSMLTRQLDVWYPGTKKTIAAALAAAAKVKVFLAAALSDPTDKKAAEAIAQFNGLLPNGTGRSLSMQLVHTDKLYELGLLPIGGDKVKALMKPWMDDKLKLPLLPKNATPDNIKSALTTLASQLKTFSQSVKYVDGWYNTVLAYRDKQ